MAAIILFVVDPGVQSRHALSRAEGAYLPLGQSEQVCCKSDANWPALDGKRVGEEGGGKEGMGATKVVGGLVNVVTGVAQCPGTAKVWSARIAS